MPRARIAGGFASLSAEGKRQYWRDRARRERGTEPERFIVEPDKPLSSSHVRRALDLLDGATRPRHGKRRRGFSVTIPPRLVAL